MTPGFELCIEAIGGIGVLASVVDVLALFDLTPLSLTVDADGGGLLIRVRLRSDDRAVRSCANKLGGLLPVLHVGLEPYPAG